MAASREIERRSLLSMLDAAMFVFAGASAVWLAVVLLDESFRPNWQALLLVVFWALAAYLVLPRLHRILTYLYVPGYFIGRTRTSDGLLGDPVNLAFLGDGSQIHATLARAGWTRADDVSLASSLRIVTTTLTRRSYPQAPVSPLHLFDRQQDFAYQQEVEGTPAKRHHVRFWLCRDGWMLPGGHAVDWLAAGAYDRRVGLSLLTFQLTHRIEADIDVERDYIVTSISEADPHVGVEIIRNFSTGYHDKNGGGDAIETDGDLPIVDVRTVVATASGRAEANAGQAKRPAPTTFGAGVAVLRGCVYLCYALVIAGDPASLSDVLGPGLARDIVLGITAVIDIGLGLAVYFGRNWARVVLMLSSAFGIVVAFLAVARDGELPTLGAGLPALALGILVLLALTSHRSRDFATRPRGVRGQQFARPAPNLP